MALMFSLSMGSDLSLAETVVAWVIRFVPLEKGGSQINPFEKIAALLSSLILYFVTRI